MNQQAKIYRCPRCGAESDHAQDVQAQYCALCGVSAWELSKVEYPAEMVSHPEILDAQDARTTARSGVHRLPVA